jgi:hypothetical protein
MFNNHSNNSKIAPKINMNLIFCTINLIIIVAVAIKSNNNSLIALVDVADPLI